MEMIIRKIIMKHWPFTLGTPRQKTVGDITLSQGFEIDLNYNPTQALVLLLHLIRL